MLNPFGSLIGWIHHHRLERPGRYVMPYLVVVLTVIAGLTLVLVVRTQGFATELRDGLVESCEKNGNPLREVLREEQHAQITSPQDPRIQALFPNLPLAVIMPIVERGNAEHRQRLRKLHPVDCVSLYP